MAKLAIKGHSTKGHEVIKILEMLGGRKVGYSCRAPQYYYYIDNFGNIIGTTELPTDIICKVFTLEEFLEKYPYKLGDKVTSTNYKGLWEIVDVLWNEKYGVLYYGINNGEKKELVCVDLLQPYKGETMKERKYTDLRLDVDQDDKLATEATIDGDKITPPENYLIGKITKLDDGMLVEFVKKKPKYPKTYEECCELLFSSSIALGKVLTSGYGCELLKKFGELRICRDAYWKISGDWKPNFANQEKKFVIANYYGELCTCKALNRNRVLVFPTEEMRDAFYENFKDLIEECKELL